MHLLHMELLCSFLVTPAPSLVDFVDLLLNLRYPSFDVRLFHRPEDLVNPLKGPVIDFVAKRQLRQAGELALALNMGRYLAKINRLPCQKVAFYDRKECFVQRILEVLLPDTLQLLVLQLSLNRGSQ